VPIRQTTTTKAAISDKVNRPGQSSNCNTHPSRANEPALYSSIWH